MSTFDYNNTLATSQRLLTKFGHSATIATSAGTLAVADEPAMGFTDAEDTPVDILAVRLPVTKREDIEYIQNTNISGNVYKFLTANNSTMKNDDVITYESRKYTVIKHKELRPDDVTLLWDCLATEVSQ